MKTALIIGGVALGAYVLWQLAKPHSPAAHTYSGSADNNTTVAVAGLLTAGINAATSIFGSSSKQQPPTQPVLNTADAVRRSDAVGITQYDALGTSDAPVVGIAGIDY